jgi:hypothetical protein
MPAPSIKRTYDPRLDHLVQKTGDITRATREGVPRSTAFGWLRAARRDVVSTDVLGTDIDVLAARVIRLQRRVRQLLAVLRLLVALLQVLDVDLARRRIPAAADKARLLRAIERSRDVLGLTRAPRLIGLSPSRLSAWSRALSGQGCDNYLDAWGPATLRPPRFVLGPPSEVHNAFSTPRTRCRALDGVPRTHARPGGQGRRGTAIEGLGVG